MADGTRAVAHGARAGAEEPPTGVAAALLVATKVEGDPEPYLATLADVGHDDLAPLRRNRERALAFWTNLYNAGTQLLLARRPELYDSSLRFLRFFRAAAVTVAGRALSLDAIEHGILRGGRSKYGLGYLPRLPWPFQRRYGIACDPRIHFALNCGAASCPTIRTYEPDAIDDQLDRATRSYLDQAVAYEPDSDVARVPRLFLWYRGDFGGASGIRAMLREYDAIPGDADPGLRYDSWDWTKADGSFA
jgi:hypothetical protein